ncbi:hypothetical protein KAFR_0H00340 [Kazachstania africana CBS 2517]|uniref:t-SNARE coiled-coil homology domain-containing protein n=1 Tax=Kazachstania africana (strain ATCC 22294 / BCRC 22015 / CBS 2517 / CECT 1963 / NBRC 1671 / NRRL Y-8276) TaxID=1071382 RepID=H2AYN7_KAZAF|nr:hypothetical protein KAFR_0H00340 [Kazachstania africana CBS 2517]CCF59443.1 hypothetical protein KAFR_0H00340 [Kazachstania africana CBS 2517]
MANLTPLFKKYVSIIEVELNDTDKTNESSISKKPYEGLTLKDSFVKECYDLLKSTNELGKILRTIETEYQNDNNLNMTESEKDDFDTDFRLQLQSYIKKYKQLEKYENDRQKFIDESILSAKSNILHPFSRNQKILTNFHRTNNKFRIGVLQSLNLIISSISADFTSLQQQRLKNRRKFQTLNFSAASPSTELDYSSVHDPVNISLSHSPVESVTDEVRRYEETMSKLTQEQIQLLETEHEELLNFKNEQLRSVEKINKTILDIVTIQNELSTHLQLQSQDINTMLDNQDEIELNIEKGNKQLNKAKKAASRSAKFTTYIAFIIGILVLLLDYIS